MKGEGGAVACGAWVVSVAGRAGRGRSKDSNAGKAENGVDEIDFLPKQLNFFDYKNNSCYCHNFNHTHKIRTY